MLERERSALEVVNIINDEYIAEYYAEFSREEDASALPADPASASNDELAIALLRAFHTDVVRGARVLREVLRRAHRIGDAARRSVERGVFVSRRGWAGLVGPGSPLPLAPILLGVPRGLYVLAGEEVGVAIAVCDECVSVARLVRLRGSR